MKIPLLSTWYLYDLALLACAALVPMLVRWPAAGLAILVAGSQLVPLVIETGSQTDLNFTVVFLPLLVGFWLPEMLQGGNRRLLGSRPARPLLAFVAVAIVAFAIGNQRWLVFAFAVGNQPWFALAQTAPLRAQIGQLCIFAFSAAAFLLAVDRLRDLRWLQTLTWLFLGLGAVYLTGRLVTPLTRFTDLVFQRGADGSLFWTWLVSLAFCQAAFNRRLHAVLRLALVGLTCAALYVGLVQARDWLSGWLPPVIAIVAVLWAGAPRLGLATTLVGAVAMALKAHHVVALVMSPDNQYSLTTRVAAWRVLGKIILANPLLGLGPANYYHDTALLPILGWYVKFSSHNNYVDIVAQTGLVGLACFLWFMWDVGRVGWRLRGRAPAGFAQAYVYGALGGLAGTLAAAMLGDWFLPFVYNVGLPGFRASVLGWIFLGGLVALQPEPHGTDA